jgi:ubiquinone/menaquinone biosynthesis C-methylase UbiE
MIDNKYKEAIEANIEVHSAMADDYNTVEPHFKPESIKRVLDQIEKIYKDTSFEKVLDLGCGTGFMIDILAPFAKEITGVDVTQLMLDKVKKPLNTNLKLDLINSDTGTVNLKNEYYDLATAYTFLDHLYDMIPTFKNCYNSLKSGGVFYADLSPNAYFWDEIKKLNPQGKYDPTIDREIKAIYSKDEEIEAQFGVKKSTFTKAEFQKHIEGGLREELLKSQLESVGFKNIQFIYHWFIGQSHLINNKNIKKEKRFKQAETIHNCLTKSLPISRNLFKYIGFIAYK